MILIFFYLESTSSRYLWYSTPISAWHYIEYKKYVDDLRKLWNIHGIYLNFRENITLVTFLIINANQKQKIAKKISKRLQRRHTFLDLAKKI